MKIIAVIPARYNSTRFPGKPLAKLENKTIIHHVYSNVIASNLFSEVIVATDDKRIFDHVINFGGNAVMTSSNHASGTDRVAEVCRNIDFDIVLNIQGDEPFISDEPLRSLINAFDNIEVNVASLMHKIHSNISNPNIVKVICDKNNFALYFSRSQIPYNRDKQVDITYFKHIGVYAFRKDYLYKFIKLPCGKLEKVEKLEQLRFLENNIKIKMIETEYNGIGIDTPEDLIVAQNLFK